MKISIVIKVFSKTCYEDGDFIAIKIYYISSSNDPNYIIFGMRGIEQLYKFKDKWLDLFCRSERSVQRNWDPSYTIADSHWRDIKFYSFKGSLGFNTQNYDNTIELVKNCKYEKLYEAENCLSWCLSTRSDANLVRVTETFVWKLWYVWVTRSSLSVVQMICIFNAGY